MLHETEAKDISILKENGISCPGGGAQQRKSWGNANNVKDRKSRYCYFKFHLDCILYENI